MTPQLPNAEYPKYLEIKIDRALIFKKHLETVKKKLKTQNNIIEKLAGTNCNSKATVHRTSTLVLANIVAEYCTPVWYRIKKVHVELNQIILYISGTVRTTQVQWFPVLVNLIPPDLRRLMHIEQLLMKFNPSLPLHHTHRKYGNRGIP